MRKALIRALRIGNDRSPLVATLLTRFASIVREEDGQDLTEYALLASFLSIAAVVTVRAIGPLVLALWNNIQVAIS